jgi:hypothetical protein
MREGGPGHNLYEWYGPGDEYGDDGGYEPEAGYENKNSLAMTSMTDNMAHTNITHTGKMKMKRECLTILE